MALWCLLSAAASGQSQNAPRGPLADVSIEQRLDAPLPLEAQFREESGKPVPLGSFFGRKPVILAFVYYRCPMLCTYVVNGVLRALRTLSLTAGRDFELVTVSIDPTDTPAIAAAKKGEFLKAYRREGAEGGVHFLTGEESSIRKLAAAAGFRYEKDRETGDFSHAAGILVVTPEGRIARYLYGVEYSPADLRLSLVEASRGKIGSPVDKILLYCSHYDPVSGRYSLAILKIVRAAGAATALLLGAFLLVRLRKEVREVPN
jgi:protein SCO1/2